MCCFWCYTSNEQKDTRDLCVVCLKGGTNKGCHAYLPSPKRWVFNINYRLCLPTVRDTKIISGIRRNETFIRAVYYLLNSIARQTSLEIREFTLPGPGPCHSCLPVTRVRSSGKTKGRVSKHKVEISKRVSWIAVVDHSSSIESR